jgi:hypothetical protein
MDENQVIKKPPTRRSREEVEGLVGEFVSRGKRRSEFCRENDLALNNLNRHLSRGKEKVKQVLKLW